MTSTTKISWADHTLNFWWGCTKISPACQNCYAHDIDQRFGPSRDNGKTHWGKGKPRLPQLALATRDANLLQKAAEKSGERPRIFVNSMSDWLDEEVPQEWIEHLLLTTIKCPDLDFLLLTKRPQEWRKRIETLAHREVRTHHSTELKNMARKWLLGTPPANIWIGTTTENQANYDLRAPLTAQIPAIVRYLSCEPLLGPIRLNQNIPIDWLITGGESGMRSRPSHPAWFRGLLRQCRSSAIPFLFKQWGTYAPECHCHPGTEKTCPITYTKHTQKPMFKCGTKKTGNHLDATQHLNFPK